MDALGELLESMLATGAGPVVLVSPFIKDFVLRRLLATIPEDIPVDVFTRWRADEVANGVSDLEVFDTICPRQHCTLFLYPALHAKYYRAGAQVLLGSANLTGTALGWSRGPNLELLIEASWPRAEFEAMEGLLRVHAIPATSEIRDRVAHAAELLPRGPPPAQREIAAGAWFVPATRNPETLFLAYRGEDLTSAAREQTAADLAALAIPPGFDKRAFTAFVGAELAQSPVVRAVDSFLEEPRRFGEMRRHIAELLVAQGNLSAPDIAWQTLARWLLHFLPDKYKLEVFKYSEIVSLRAAKGQDLP